MKFEKSMSEIETSLVLEHPGAVLVPNSTVFEHFTLAWTILYKT